MRKEGVYPEEELHELSLSLTKTGIDHVISAKDIETGLFYIRYPAKEWWGEPLLTPGQYMAMTEEERSARLNG